MASGVVAALAGSGREPAGGVIVAPRVDPSPHPEITVVAGDHPIPGAGSERAAAAIGAVASQVGPGDTVLALVSGGGSSLAAAPAADVDQFTQADMAALYEALLASGADIAAINSVRKRFARWSGGRLALAVGGAHVHCLVVSDVPGDDVASISSGPCAADPVTAPKLVARAQASGLWARLPGPAQRHLTAAARGEAPETPKPQNPAFQHVSTRVIVSNAHALAAAAERARTLGVGEVAVERTPLTGEASIAGVRLASDLIARRKRARGPWTPHCVIWGGETTVTFAAGGGSPHGVGGRNQEIALAAARSLADGGDAARGITLLAAGTDGRDGPTDAAGAIVDSLTWSSVQGAGRKPETDLATHNAYSALDAAGALLRTGPTGTNVMDVVIGLIL